MGERGETNTAPVAVAWDTEKGKDWQQSGSDGDAGGTEDHNLEWCQSKKIFRFSNRNITQAEFREEAQAGDINLRIISWR